MSYADVAASGPPQPASERAAPPVPEIEPSTASTSSLIDVDSPHISSVPSDFSSQSVKTDTQATRLEHETEDRALAARNAVEEKAKAASKKAGAMADKAKKELSADARKAEKELKKGMSSLSDNRENPVVVGNALLWGITAVVLGVGAYKANSEGKLDWKLAGTVAGAVGVLGVADYFGSQWLLENKYPPK